jgi:uncharacterized protein YwqG
MISSLTAPAIHVLTSLEASLSHFGGSPRLPKDVRWPEFEGRKLGFLARLSLSEIQVALPIEWLPKSGALLFFYDLERQPWGFDPKDRGSSAVLIVPDLPAPVSGRGAPTDGALPQRNVVFRRIESHPSSERESVRSLDLTDREHDKLGDIAYSVFEKSPQHQIAGFPSPVQGDEMELECQLASNGLYCGDSSGYTDPRVDKLKVGAGSWKLLFQMDSDDELNVMWGDAGIIYYWIEESAARSGDFSNAWLILQCC